MLLVAGCLVVEAFSVVADICHVAVAVVVLLLLLILLIILLLAVVVAVLVCSIRPSAGIMTSTITLRAIPKQKSRKQTRKSTTHKKKQVKTKKTHKSNSNEATSQS